MRCTHSQRDKGATTPGPSLPPFVVVLRSRVTWPRRGAPLSLPNWNMDGGMRVLSRSGEPVHAARSARVPPSLPPGRALSQTWWRPTAESGTLLGRGVRPNSKASCPRRLARALARGEACQAWNRPGTGFGSATARCSRAFPAGWPFGLRLSTSASWNIQHPVTIYPRYVPQPCFIHGEEDLTAACSPAGQREGTAWYQD